MEKKFFYVAAAFVLFSFGVQAQTYTPVNLTGYNHDFVAESYPSSLAGTDTVLDGSNNVMYSQAFATAASFSGGLPNNGIITDPTNTRQFQLAPYNGLNMLNVMRNATRSYSLATPASYQKLSVLAFSTEGPSMVTISLSFTDGSSTTYISSLTLPDWFAVATSLAGSGYGRVSRAATGTIVSGAPTNPSFSYIDINLNCADRKKVVQTINFSNVTTTGTNAPYPNAVFLAVSGQADTQAVTPSSTPSSCGVSNGSATVSVTGNTGPYSVSWNTTPAQITSTIQNLAAGTYIATITDVNGCTTTRNVVVTQLISPSSITATATPSVVCSGSSTQLAVAATGGTLSSYTWTPGNATTTSVTVTPTITTTYTVLGQDGAGCPYSKQITVTVNQRPTAPTAPNVNVCQGNNGVLQVQSPQSGYIYNWYTASSGGSAVATGPSYTLTTVPLNATYYVEAISSGCSSTSRTPVVVSLLPVPQVNAGTDQTIISGDVIQLNGTGSQGTYLWTPSTGLSSTNILNPNASPTTTTTYTLTVTHPLGCTKSDDVLITVFPNCIKPMQLFSPNGDGINDVWKISDGTCFLYAKVGIYNRYGNTVYRSDDYKNNWDGKYEGKPVADGTYYFVITYALVNGKLAYLKGNVTILR
jgi:gliding motility-associated-like protein